IIGPPNAGKSTLANRLLGGDRIITSDIPGTTRDWISETALINGWPVTLTDTAGVRDATCEIESEAIRRGQTQARSADLVIIVLDATRPSAEQVATCKKLADSVDRAKRIVVQNKRDLPSAEPINPPDENVIGISALMRQGLSDLERAIESHLGWASL